MYFFCYSGATGYIVGAGQPLVQAARKTLTKGGRGVGSPEPSYVALLSVCSVAGSAAATVSYGIARPTLFAAAWAASAELLRVRPLSIVQHLEIGADP